MTALTASTGTGVVWSYEAALDLSLLQPGDVESLSNVMDSVEKEGKQNSRPFALEIGANSQIEANIYAPDGTIEIRSGSVFEGALIGRDIIVGEGVMITMDNGF